MNYDDKLVPISSRHPEKRPDNLKDALQLVADLTGEAKKAAEENPLTSFGKPKSSLRGATIITNGLKEEGIEAYRRGLVSEPTMKGGLKNNDMHVAAKAALKGIELSEQQMKSLPDKDEE